MWDATENLRLSASFAFYDSELQNEYCPGCNGDGTAWAPAGTKLPVTADFKGNLVARYTTEIGNYDAYFQGALAHEGERSSDLRVANNDLRGDVPAYTTLDLAAGIRKDTWGVDLFMKNVTGEDAPLYLTAQCAVGTCGAQSYGVRIRPMTVGLKFTKDWD